MLGHIQRGGRPTAVDRMLERFSQTAAARHIYVVCCNDTATADGKLHNTAFLIGRDGRIVYKLVGPITAENLDRTLLPEIEKALR